MRQSAIVALVNQYCEAPARFSYVERPQPPLPTHSVEIAVSAVSVNPLDLLMASGYGRRIFGLGAGGRLPLQLGRDGSGVVTRVGTRVCHLQPGMAVWFGLPPFRRGSYATHIQIDSALASPAPAELTATQSASLPYAGVTALRLLEAAGLDERQARGRRVFIHGASGGIGLVLLDLLHAWGATVFVSAAPAVFDALKGRAPCTCFNSRTDEIMRGIAECDTLLDLVASHDARFSIERRFIETLPAGGRYATPVTPVPDIVDETGLVSGLVRSGLYRHQAMRAAARREIDYRWVFFKPGAARLDALATSISRGFLSTPPLSTYGFRALSAAHDAARQSPHLGKIVVQVSAGGSEPIFSSNVNGARASRIPPRVIADGAERQ
ncbi:zinc-binding dehydrogenase [Paraburkholderia sp. BL9I2N2]|uniref:zinc-binding dehydrogenase n=1 Tax=Paraburkholderia sp. BL9I2N2 TaxID=1938809 RepID=UPI0010525393|nr:zinc-binding dehydrogenase [Paraburkholderia sp. BL9I2N2]TCK84032.1 NADPH:quinone reductase-like Zn-dependent oxidoreductase [Paraburkholderia sp. BL9I2N2]